MKLKNLILAVIVLLCTAVCFAGCSETNEEIEINSDIQIETPEPEETPELPQEPEVPQIPEFINKLTGEETTEELENIRPVAIMINNIKMATPQQGISHADVIYEVLAEGGITRLLCLFTDYANLPVTGSIRSARDYYIDLSDAHDAIYVHCGTSPAADETLAARKTENMNGMNFNTPFYRDSWRMKNMGYEHSLMTTGEKLVEGIEKKGYRTESDAVQPLSFKTTQETFDGESAQYAGIKFSYYAKTELEYDAELGVYNKKQYGAEHIDSNTGEQLKFENALILFCTQGMVPGDEAGRLYVNFYGDGDGYYICDGVYKNIKWHKDTRTSSYTLYEQDGETELLLNPGKTYIAIAPMDAEITFE